MAERRLVAAPPTGTAERTASVRRKHPDLIRQPAQPHVQGAERFERQVHGEMRAEQVGARDRPEHHRTT